jgi:hypothetical protein
MQQWQAIVPIVQDWLDRSAMFLSDLPLPLVLALLLLPIVLVIYSRNTVLGLICLLMVFAAGLVFVAPANTALILAMTLYVGSILASLTAIITSRRKRDDLTILRMQVGDLMAAEQRRIMRNSSSNLKG